ncbi:MAG: thiamine pyrophosphate-binding protein [Thaumarchaeota archaeon]|nr:thiamine pyrophosphate-binding protein [Nitrososphaerota archaeon]
MRATGSEAAVKSLELQGVDKVFGLLGSGYLDIVDVMHDAGIRFVGVRHEQTASLMADGYARVTLGPGVCMAGEGAGATNLLTGVAVAFKGNSPVVAMTPATDTKHLFSQAHQELDHSAIFRAVTKETLLVPRADRIPEFMNRAFSIAMSGRKGPVHIDIPRDFQFAEFDWDVPEIQSRDSSPGGFVPGSAAKEIVGRLAKAERPVIIAGGGVVWADATAELIRLAEALDVPVTSARGHNDVFPNGHRLWLGALGYYGSRAAMSAVAESDLIFAVGTKLSEASTAPYYGFEVVRKGSAIIQADIEPRALGWNFPVELAVSCDAKALLGSMLAAIDSGGLRRKNPRWVDRTASSREDFAKELSALVGKETKLVNPYGAYSKLREILPGEAIVTLDAGILSQGIAFSTLGFDSPRTLLAPVGIGNIGFSLGEALGAKAAKPDAPVLSLSGDGAFSMMGNEIMTAVQEEINVVCIVFNNSAWGTEKWYQSNVYGRVIGSDLKNPDFAEFARLAGAWGARVDSLKEFEDAVREALGKNRPSVIDVQVDPSIIIKSGRAGTMSKPARHVYT